MTTHEEKTAREDTLEKILQNNTELKHDRDIVPLMKQAGWPKYDRHQCHKDRMGLARRNTFVVDLSSSLYSQKLENMFEEIKNVRKEAHDLIRDAKSGDTKFKNWTITQALKLIDGSVKTEESILSGKALDISVSMLGKKLQALEEENAKLKQGKTPKGMSTVPSYTSK